MEIIQARQQHRQHLQLVLAVITKFRTVKDRITAAFECRSAVFLAELWKQYRWPHVLHPALSPRVLHIPPITRDQIFKRLRHIPFSLQTMIIEYRDYEDSKQQHKHHWQHVVKAIRSFAKCSCCPYPHTW